MIKLLLTDDHLIFRSGLKRLLSDEADLQVAGEAGDQDTCLAFLRRQAVDAVLLDINLPGASGFDVLGVIRKAWPALPVLMLSMYREPVYAQHAQQSGANGYVTKDSAPDDLLKAIRMVASGKTWFSRAPGVGAPAHTKLSQREWQVMALMVQGLALTRIAADMALSVKTISTHRRRMLDKLDLQSNAELVGYAFCHQLDFSQERVK
ncbi:MAG: DNA-binding response regulator [Betaproteobacteria bacterium]|nr:DNA-binding response regulator [Betaproteobacteria bacterium]